MLAAIGRPGEGPGTSQPPAMRQVHYAGFWIRFVAAWIDYLVLAIGAAVGAVIGGFLLFVIYKGTCLACWQGQTVGKYLCGIRVVNDDLTPCTTGQAFCRTFSELLNWLTLDVGYAIAAFSDRKRGLHDMIAGTVHIYHPRG